MHTSILGRFPYNCVIYTRTSDTHTMLACTPHTHTIHNPLRPHRHHTHNQATYRNPLIHICHNQNTHTTWMHHTHTHTQALLSRFVTWLLPPKQTKCVSPAIASIHEFFTSWNRGVAGSGRLVAGTWGKGSSPPLACLPHTHRGNKLFCRIEFVHPIHLVLSFYNIM